MSRIAISLIIGSIFIVTLCHALARHASDLRTISGAQILLACGLLFSITKIYTAWLKAPPPRPTEDENNDQQNEK